MKEKQKIMITGANGQLGKELKELCAVYPGFEFIFFPREDLPIQNFELVRSTFKIHQPKYCINCAAYTAVDKAESEKEMAFLINGEAVGVLAAVCQENGSKFIHISTDYVFDGNTGTPYKETDATNPVNVYGASKLAGEEEAFQFNEDALIIRTSWVYSSFGKNFVKTMLRLMSEKEAISVVNDQEGSPTYAADIAVTILDIISSGNWRPGIYHFSNEGQTSWYEFALEIKKISGSPCNIQPISTGAYPTPAKRPVYSVLDKTRIKETFGIKLIPWQDSLRKCIDKINAQHTNPA